MNKILLLSAVVIIVQAFVSCGASSTEKEMRKQIDSLENVNALGQMQYEDLQNYLAIMAAGLDSISMEENALIVNFSNEHGRYDRARMKENLTHVRQTLARHREKIDSLEKRLSEDNGQLKNLRVIVAHLREQLEAKDRELNQLRLDLDDSRKNISILANRVQEITEENEIQATTIEAQAQTIVEQQQKMNTAYVKMGSKKELEQAGLLTGGGFLKSKKVDYGNIDLSIFQPVDINTFSRLEMPKKSKIITNVPKDSYTIQKSGNAEILVVTNPQKFWSVSNFLIIQTK